MGSRQPSRPPHLFVCCGEASGDRYGAALVSALRRRVPGLRVTAVGGERLAAVGAEIVQPAAPIAVMGFGEVLGALPAVLAARRRVWRHLRGGGIDLCVPIDFPGFNLRVARQARALGIPVFYVVPPQLWAWGAWRLPSLRRAVSRVGTILPFETEFFRERDVPVVPLGHPLIEDYPADACAEATRRREARLADPEVPVTVGLLPGSRRQEVRRLLPDLVETTRRLRLRIAPRPLVCVVSAAAGRGGQVPPELRAAADAGLEISWDPLPELLPRLDLALVCSGTASLEAALAGVPHEIVYRTSAFNYLIARSLIRVRRIGLANLILGEDVAAEHIQGAVAPARLAEALAVWTADPARRALFAERTRRLRARLGGPGVWDRAAGAALELLRPRPGEG